jgi:hypothetical protein
VIEVVGYDVNASSGGNQARDDFMAAELRRLYRAPARQCTHAGADWQCPRHAAAAGRYAAGNADPADGLGAAGLDIYSVRLGALRGQAACADRCMARPLPEQAGPRLRGDTHAGGRTTCGWMPQLSVGTLVDP